MFWQLILILNIPPLRWFHNISGWNYFRITSESVHVCRSERWIDMSNILMADEWMKWLSFIIMNLINWAQIGPYHARQSTMPCMPQYFYTYLAMAMVVMFLFINFLFIFRLKRFKKPTTIIFNSGTKSHRRCHYRPMHISWTFGIFADILCFDLDRSH